MAYTTHAWLHAIRKFSTDLDSKLLGLQVCSHKLQLPVKQRLCSGADHASLQTQQGLCDRPGGDIKMWCPDALTVESIAPFIAA